MTFEKEEGNEKHLDIVVDHFHSLVVEVISLLALQSKLEKGSQPINIEGNLSDESKVFLQKWIGESTFDFIQLLNFFIPCPYFHDMQLFVGEMRQLSDEDFLYHLFGEELDSKKIKELLKSPSSYMKSNETIFWDSELKQAFTLYFIENLSYYRLGIEKLLLEVAASSELKQFLAHKMVLIEEGMKKVKELPMEPLTLAQYIMGKNFRRVSNYRIYFFIPSYFFPYKMRIFNSNLCMVFYNCSSQLSDDLQQSKDLDAKLKALTDPNRLILLRMLSGQKLYGARLAEYLGVTTATVSHHLDLLKKAGFIDEERVGTIKYFTSNKENLNAFFDQVKKFMNN